MDDLFLNSLSLEARNILVLVQGGTIHIEHENITAKGLIDIENAINFHLNWFKTIDLNNIPRHKLDFTIQKIQTLLMMTSVYNTLAPDNPTANKVQQFVNNAPEQLIQKSNWVDTILTPPPPNKKRKYHKVLFYGAELNRGRLDISACLGLINACFIFSQHKYTPEHQTPYIDDINFYFGMASLILPFVNLSILANQFWKKYSHDLASDHKTKQLDLLWQQKRLTFLKNFLNLIINTTTFLIAILELFPMQFYFASINIGLDFAFYCWDYYEKNYNYLIQRGQEFITLEETLPDTYNLIYYDAYLKMNPKDRIKYLCDIYEQIFNDSTIKDKEACLFLIISMISNEQKNTTATYKFYLELLTFSLMIITLLVIQHSVFPALNAELTMMMGLLMLYIYHGLKSVIIENPIQINQNCVVLQDSQNKSIYLKNGEISQDYLFGHCSSFDLQLVANVGVKLALPVIGMVMLLNMAPALAIPIFISLSICIKLAEISLKPPPNPDLESIPAK
jgi:hypothetical protein